MKRKRFVKLSLWLLTVMLSTISLRAQQDVVGAVYTMTNNPSGNAVLLFNRAADGVLTPAGIFPTGGLGTGGIEPDLGLANAGAVTLSDNLRWLFVVNPGSDDLSVFALKRRGLELVDRERSGGKQPVSVTSRGNLVYVLNAGGNVGASDNITGFVVTTEGKLLPLSNSTRPLSTHVTAPAQIKFNPAGSVLIVTEKATNAIDTYTVGKDGRASGPIVSPSDAQTPFGFYLSNGNQLFVSDDFGDAQSAGSLSSFLVSDDGTLQLVSSVVHSNETGACWTVVSDDGHFAYVSNTVSSTVSVYSIDTRNGSVTFDQSFPSPSGPIDLDTSRDGRFLYVLNSDISAQGANPGINVFRRNERDGSLTRLPGVNGLPASVDGLAVR